LPPAKYLAPLCHQLWSTEEVIPKITGIPILFLAGCQDEIVPHEHMQQLYKLSRAFYKEWREFPYGSHNDTVAEKGYFEYFDDFLEKRVLA
jgi:abhydrolase domain-containing protein 13